MGLVTLTDTLRVAQDEVLSATVRENRVRLRFWNLKPRTVAVDDLTPEAREWLLPSLAPREIPTGCECDGGDYAAEEGGEGDEAGAQTGAVDDATGSTGLQA